MNTLASPSTNPVGALCAPAQSAPSCKGTLTAIVAPSTREPGRHFRPGRPGGNPGWIRRILTPKSGLALGLVLGLFAARSSGSSGMTYAYSSQQTSANLPAGKSKFSAAAAHKFPSADMNTHPKDAGSVQAPAPTKATKSFHCVSCKFTLNNKTNNTRTPIKIKMCSDAAGREKNKRRCELLKGIEYDSTKAYTEDVKTFKNTHCLFLNTELKYSGQEEKNKHLCQSTWQKIDQKEKKATFRPRTTTSTPKNRRVIVKCLPDPKRAKNAAQLAKVYEVSASEQDAPRACGRGRYMGHIVLNR